MKKEKKLLIGLLLITLFISSCGNFDKIEIGEPEDFKIKGFEDNFLMVDVKVPVNNPTIYRVKITEVDLRVYLNKKYIGKLEIDKKLIIKGKKSALYSLPIKVRLNNLLGAAFIMMNVKKGQQVELKLEGKVAAKSLLIKKSVEINETKKIVI